MSNRRDVLVVRVKEGTIQPDCFDAFREYIISSILRDVLVIDETTTLTIEELPCVELPELMISVDQATEENSLPEEIAAVKPPPKPTARKEKQDILDRLLAYRERNGLGSLNDVANKTNVRSITVDTLRLLVKGDATLSLAEWRAIGRALKKLEEIEGMADGEDA